WPWGTFFFSLRRDFWLVFGPEARDFGGICYPLLLLAGDGALRALAGARVGLGALAVHREPTAVTQALVAAALPLAPAIAPDRAGARVGLGALAVHREATAVTQALVAADLDLATDIGLDLAAEVTFDLERRALDVVTQLRDLLVGEILRAQVRADARGRQDL